MARSGEYSRSASATISCGVREASSAAAPGRVERSNGINSTYLGGPPRAMGLDVLTAANAESWVKCSRPGRLRPGRARGKGTVARKVGPSARAHAREGRGPASRLLLDQVLRRLLVFVADELDQLLLRVEAPVHTHRERLRVGFRILDRHVDLHPPVVHP